MTYIFIGALLALAAQQILHWRQVKAERAQNEKRERRIHSDLRDALDHARELQNQIVLLKVEPTQAAALAGPEPEAQPAIVMDDSPAADTAWAEYLDRVSS
jgi:hypothetical protein